MSHQFEALSEKSSHYADILKNHFDDTLTALREANRAGLENLQPESLLQEMHAQALSFLQLHSDDRNLMICEATEDRGGEYVQPELGNEFLPLEEGIDIPFHPRFPYLINSLMITLNNEGDNGEVILSHFDYACNPAPTYAYGTSVASVLSANREVDELRLQLAAAKREIEQAKALNQQRQAVNAQTRRLTGQTYDGFYSSNRTAVATVAYQEIKDLDGPNVEKFISQVRTHQLNNLELTKQTRNQILGPIHSVLTQHVKLHCKDGNVNWETWEDTHLVEYLKEHYPRQRKDKLDTTYRALLRNVHLNLRTNIPLGIQTFVNSLNRLNYETPINTKETLSELEAVKVVIEGICPTAMKPHANEIYISIKEDLTAQSITTWDALIQQLLILQGKLQGYQEMRLRYPDTDNNKWHPGQTLSQSGKKRPREDQHTSTDHRSNGGTSDGGGSQAKHHKGPKPGTPITSQPVCDGCGRRSTALSSIAISI